MRKEERWGEPSKQVKTFSAEMKMITIPKEIVSLNPDEINLNDEAAVRSIIIELLNMIEQLAQREKQLEEENQALKAADQPLLMRKSKIRKGALLSMLMLPLCSLPMVVDILAFSDYYCSSIRLGRGRGKTR